MYLIKLQASQYKKSKNIQWSSLVFLHKSVILKIFSLSF